jgi:TetR/AcrR family transcriptional regulator, transcriptional repressor for nem operon
LLINASLHTDRYVIPGQACCQALFRVSIPIGMKKSRVRAPDATRQKLLGAAFEEIYRRGYQAASLDIILSRAGVTKGALYHHFTDKHELGLSVVDEIISGFLLDRWLGPLQSADGDPLEALVTTFRHRARSVEAEEVELGCPLNNIAQEMSPLDPEFRRHIEAAFGAWRRGFARALQRGQERGTVRKDIDAKKVANFLVAATEGSYSIAKSAGSRAMLRSNFENIAGFLETLRIAG